MRSCSSKLLLAVNRQKRDEFTPEGRQFVAYLTKTDPYFPSWEFACPGTLEDYAMHPRFRAKLARYYEQWRCFKSESDENEGRR
jgi:hypothetical protein